MEGKRILTLGAAYVDFNVPGFPFESHGIAPETEVIGGDYDTAAGGSAVTFARVCTRLGFDTTFVGKIGGDTNGELLAQRLISENIRPGLIADNSVSTNISFNLINEVGQTIMLVAGNANQALTPQEVVGKITPLLGKLDYLYLGGCFKLKRLLPACEQLTARVQQSGVKLIVDHGRVPLDATAEDRARVRALAEKADYYLPSRDEFLELWHVSSIEAGLRSLTTKADAIVAVKCAELGAYSIDDDEIIHMFAFQVAPRNTVGAGDSFNAGLIAAQSSGLNLRKSLEFGCAVAALKISRDTLPTRGQVDKFLASNPQLVESDSL